MLNFLAHLVEAMRAYMAQHPLSIHFLSSVWYHNFNWKDFFSRTIRAISTKLGRKHSLGMGF